MKLILIISYLTSHIQNTISTCEEVIILPFRHFLVQAGHFLGAQEPHVAGAHPGALETLRGSTEWKGCACGFFLSLGGVLQTACVRGFLERFSPAVTPVCVLCLVSLANFWGCFL